MRCLACVILVALACEAASGQLERRGPEFEVASVKPSQPPTGGPFRVGTSGGPGSKDPTLWACENFSLSNLITMAYGIAHYQLSGPDWLGASMFDVTARVPEGATRDQFKLMLQNLLAERFKLTVHHESKDLPVYELAIAKGGPKLKESVEDVAPKDDTTDAAPSRPPTPAPPNSVRTDIRSWRLAVQG